MEGWSRDAKMVKTVEESDKLRRTYLRWHWRVINFLPPVLILISFLLFPLALRDFRTTTSSSLGVGLGMSFALVASGFLPLILLPWAAARSRLSLLGNRLSLVADLFGVVNIGLHIAYGLKLSNLLVTALVLAIGQAVCFVAAGILLVIHNRRPKTVFTISRNNDPLQQLQFKDRKMEQAAGPSLVDPILYQTRR
ncbi:uncharacterized protein N7473_011176 [Penicillium subrubescens]|uniref:uncharacterized protein n=1 Tax=Penicillium subrubescens TaxID=1316194 RepID=UPI0025458239|nr:uncharacterized protein N7473_011176 [Penicillium subrubescens]KAJ5882742.1 hypothetical protein N7473_011176 [Penicillium subrubescens]